MTLSKTYIPNLLALVFVVAAGCAGEPARQLVDSRTPASGAERQIVLTVSQNRSGAFRIAGAPGRPYIKRSGYGSSVATGRLLDELAKEYQLRRIDGWYIASLGVYCEVFEIQADRSIDATLARLKSDTRVESAQTMNVFRVLANRNFSGYGDPYVSMQRAVKMLQLEAAHLWSRGEGITIAVIDTGVDRGHPELKKNVVAMEDFVGIGQHAATMDVHGTAVTGVIASQADNGIGIVGVAPEVEILALRACWPIRAGATAARCSSFTLAKALEFAISRRVDILNLSLAGPADPLLLRLIGAALERGILVVSAVDPESRDAGFPSAEPRVISVDIASGEWRSGLAVSETPFRVVAPGTNVLTTTPDGNFGFLSGTSIAAAHVTGVSALLLERAPDLTPEDIASLLSGSIYRVDDDYSINACLALADLLKVSGCESIEIARQ